ncbi:MAG: DinB family protein [bacterium]|nr:DinB family protein [bacterium]
MDPKILVVQLKSAREYFERSTRCLVEEDSEFAPAEGMMTAAQQIAHVAQTVDWFFEGAFRPEGFDMNFDELLAKLNAVTSIEKTRAWLAKSFAAAEEAITSRSAEELSQPLPEGPVMGGAPRFAIVDALADHTAHHRGILTVYSRLRGHVPAMPYMED